MTTRRHPTQEMEQSPNRTRPGRIPRWPFWIGGGVLVFLAAIAVVIAIAAHRAEPFVRKQVVQVLSEHFHTHVELDSFHFSLGNTFRGEWGIWGDGHGLRIWPPSGEDTADFSQPQPNVQPLIRLDEFHFQAPLHYKEGVPIHISQVRLNGLEIRFPPRSAMQRISFNKPRIQNAASSNWNVQFVVDLVDCANARLTLETDKLNKLPLEFDIMHFRLKNVQSGRPINFEASLQNPKPPGAIHSTGSFGPWVVEDPGSSPVRGDYTFDHADLSVFKGIAGILNSTGRYEGMVRRITVDGETDTPDFQLTNAGHAMNLHTNFHALVDGTNGDTWLDPVDGTMGNSGFSAKGQVVRVLKTGADGRPHSIGHDMDLAVDVKSARIEDFLRLATSSATPILGGNVAVKAQLHISPGEDRPVSERIALKGQFVLDNAAFSSDAVQKRIRELSLRGQGKPDQLKSDPVEAVTSHVAGDFSLNGGVLTLPSVTYSVPGADIRLHGTYSTKSEILDFTGTAKLQATVSQAVGGWKGILLKPADRFFKKDGAGTEVPIYIAGTRDKPRFGYDSAHAGGTHPQRPDTQ